VLGVDRFLDMCRTTLNVVGDLVAAQVISAGEPADEKPVAAAEEMSAVAEARPG
jgi:DAACS family dicarboxylate/amino acid:cation (Na+ or H+) symporter